MKCLWNTRAEIGANQSQTLPAPAMSYRSACSIANGRQGSSFKPGSKCPSQHAVVARPILVLTCFSLRTENRSRKTHVFEYRDCGVGWGGVGGHVNVPCTSYMIYCHAAKISGIIYYVTCCYAAEISGIVYYVTYMLLRC